MSFPRQADHSVAVLVTGVDSSNNLGVIRGLGERGITIHLLDIAPGSMVRHSKYLREKLSCPDPASSEVAFVDFLRKLGRQAGCRFMIIPTSDAEALALSKHREELLESYLIPTAPFDVVKTLVNKKLFYQQLESMSVPYPKTWFPSNLTDVRSMCREVPFPFIIKPVYSHRFLREFNLKAFVITSDTVLDAAVDHLTKTHEEIMVQEIIPGDEIYMLSTYFDSRRNPVAVCGYDKLRQSPPDFGNGSLCRSFFRQWPVSTAMDVLKALEYRGIAEAEFKKDPRDGSFKLLEINARTTTQSILATRCGAPMEYLAYQDLVYGHCEKPSVPLENVLWMDELNDLYSCLIQVRRGKLSPSQVLKSFMGRKVFAVASLDDPLPFLASFYNFTSTLIMRKLIRLVRTKSNTTGSTPENVQDI